MFKETLEEIEAEIFGAAQNIPVGVRTPIEGDSPRRLTAELPHDVAKALGPGGGMHILSGNSPRRRAPDTDPVRIAYKRAHERKQDRERIKAAILRGERPKSRRSPTRWLDVAKELGIDLMAPVTSSG
jgi:hypothetical protein